MTSSIRVNAYACVSGSQFFTYYSLLKIGKCVVKVEFTSPMQKGVKQRLFFKNTSQLSLSLSELRVFVQKLQIPEKLEKFPSMVAVRGMMKSVNSSVMVVISVLLLLGVGGKWLVEAEEVHHVIGGDRGWDSSSNVQAWSSRRSFRVGDNIWFAYSAAEEIIAELSSREEFDTCNVSNPIKMYTDGLNRVKLEGEGSRYFASGTAETCKNGLKLHVNVLPSQPQSPATKSVNKPVISSSITSTVMADGPTTPSSSTKLGAGVLFLWVLLISLLSHDLGF